MFYVTLYYTYNKSYKNMKANIALSYASEADAVRFKDYCVNRAKELGAAVVEENGYYKIEGEVCTDAAYFFGPSSTGMHYYMIGIETDDTKFVLDTEDENSYSSIRTTKKGHEFENMMARFKARREADYEAKYAVINKNLARYEKELETVTDLTDILNVVIKYSKQKTDKAKLIQLAVDKIQGKAPAKEEDWYDELSDINN